MSILTPFTLLASCLPVRFNLNFPFYFSVLLNLKNIRLSLPQTIGNVFIERLADYLLVKSTFGFSLAWDGGSGVYLKMSEEHHGAPCGLCGNFNHIAGDDLTTARGRTGFSERRLTQLLLLHTQHSPRPIIVAVGVEYTRVAKTDSFGV